MVRSIASKLRSDSANLQPAADRTESRGAGRSFKSLGSVPRRDFLGEGREFAHSWIAWPELLLECVDGNELGSDDLVAGLEPFAVTGGDLLVEAWVVGDNGRDGTLPARVERLFGFRVGFDPLAVKNVLDPLLKAAHQVKQT